MCGKQCCLLMKQEGDFTCCLKKSLSEEKVEEHWGEDVDFILHLSDEIKNHWEKEKTWHENYHKEVRKRIQEKQVKNQKEVGHF